jgi:nucleotidyltransferase substrate binding protein (TIGR01987 family)
MAKTKLEALKEEFQEAVQRLEEVLREKKTDYIRDSAIKRFELAFDLSWKLLKAFLEEKGVACASPLGCFREAYHQGIIDYEEVFQKLLPALSKERSI